MDISNHSDWAIDSHSVGLFFKQVSGAQQEQDKTIFSQFATLSDPVLDEVGVDTPTCEWALYIKRSAKG